MIENEPTVESLEALAKDEAHIRRNALRLAGIYLQGVKDEMMEAEIGKLDDDIQAEDALYAAYEAMLENIIDEVVRIGEELSRQAKEMKRQ